MFDLRGAGRGAYLRLVAPELDGAVLVVRAVPAEDRDRRRHASSAPLGYLYERHDEDAPDADLRLAAGHYDETALVWSFSGEIHGITGITRPAPPPGPTGPAGQRKDAP